MLLVAPHKGETATGAIARNVAQQLECLAIINVDVSRSGSDLNRKKGASEYPEFTAALESWAGLKRDNKPLVIWLHGHQSPKPECVYGYGQPDNLIADEKIVKALVSQLKQRGVVCVDASNGFKRFAARKQNNMAQYLKQQGFDVNSIQFELSSKTRAQPGNFADNLSGAIRAVMMPVEEAEPSTVITVESVATKVMLMCEVKLREMALEIGRYFVNTLYGGDFKRAKNPRKNEGNISFHKVCKRVYEQGGPSVRWLYNALHLAVDDHEYGSMKAYAKLGLSKRAALLDLKAKSEFKRALIEQASDKNMSVRELKAIIKERNYIAPTLEQREKMLVQDIGRRERAIEVLQKQVKELQRELEEVREKLGE